MIGTIVMTKKANVNKEEVFKLYDSLVCWLRKDTNWLQKLMDNVNCDHI